MSKSLGELAFEAYVANRGGKNHDGSPTPSWADLGDGVRGGWEASALAVARRMPALEGAKFVAVKVGAFGEGPGRGATSFSFSIRMVATRWSTRSATSRTKFSEARLTRTIGLVMLGRASNWLASSTSTF